MSGDEITPNGSIELSNEELDNIAGGFDLSITASRFFKTKASLNPGAPRLGRGTPSFETETIESSVLHIVIKDATTDDLEVLGGLLGDASAIEGGD